MEMKDSPLLQGSNT